MVISWSIPRGTPRSSL